MGDHSPSPKLSGRAVSKCPVGAQTPAAAIRSHWSQCQASTNGSILISPTPDPDYANFCPLRLEILHPEDDPLSRDIEIHLFINDRHHHIRADVRRPVLSNL